MKVSKINCIIDHLNFKLWIFSGYTASFKIEVCESSGFWKFRAFTHVTSSSILKSLTQSTYFQEYSKKFSEIYWIDKILNARCFSLFTPCIMGRRQIYGHPCKMKFFYNSTLHKMYFLTDSICCGYSLEVVLQDTHNEYCQLRNFCEHFILANSVKIYLRCKNSRLEHDLRTSVKGSDFCYFTRVLISWNFVVAKFRKNKTLINISEYTVS